MLLIRESDPIEHKGFYFPTYFSKSCIHLLFAEGEDDDLVANDCRAKVQAILGNTRHMRDHEEGRWWLALKECPHLLINSGDGFERRPTGKLKTVELFLDVIEAPLQGTHLILSVLVRCALTFICSFVWRAVIGCC